MLVNKTVFDDRVPLIRKLIFEDLNILLPLNLKPKLTMLIIERLYTKHGQTESSMRNIDME